MSNLFPDHDAYQKNKADFFFSREEWSQNRVQAMELTVLGHVFFLRTRERMDSGLEFPEKIENGHTFIHKLLADTFRALNVMTYSFKFGSLNISRYAGGHSWLNASCKKI